jgi:hypothetical protein
MANEVKAAELKLPRNGFYVKGVVISTAARLFKRKDGSGVGVRVITELALQPGVATYERFYDPAKDTEVKVQGEQIVSFPKLADFTSLTLRVEKYRVYDDKLIITAAEKVG